MPLDEFAPRVDIYAIQAVLDEASMLDLRRDHLNDLVAVLSMMLSGFLAHAPLPPWRRPFAVGAIELTCWLNGLELSLSDTERTMLLREGSRRHANRRRLEEWLAAHIEPLSPVAAQAARMRAREQLGAPYRDRPRLYISARFTAASPALREELVEAANKIQEVAHEVAREMRAPIGVEPSHAEHDWAGLPIEGDIAIEAPWREATWREPQPSCDYNRAELCRANALIVLAPEGGSHTTGCEHAMVPLDAQVLYMAFGDDEPLPHGVEGNLTLRPTMDDRIFQPSEAAGAASAFLMDTWQSIERSWRLSELREFVYGPLADEFADRFLEYESEQRAARLASCGLRPELERQLTCAQALSQLGTETLNRVAAAFGIEIPTSLGRGTRPGLGDAERDALSKYQHEYQVLPGTIIALRREAERRLALGTLRDSLTSTREWRDLHGRLREEGAG
ncbi:MAG TPA: hypothetical protein VFG58_07490 [Solirubrobacterales bacterium]|nr:hypothetical protein [Solirubrobacterales bacterium]